MKSRVSAFCHRWRTTYIISHYFPLSKCHQAVKNPNPAPSTHPPPPLNNILFKLSFRPQFHDKMDPLLETLEGAAQRLRQPPPVAAEVEKIREQLAEHRAQGLELDKLLPSFSALCARGEELIRRAAHDDPAAQGESPDCTCGGGSNNNNNILDGRQANRSVRYNRKKH